MAQEFKSARRIVGTSEEVLYTVPSGKTAVVIGCQVSNVTDTTAWLTMSWVSGSNVTRLARQIPVPGEAAYEPIGGRLVLPASATLRVESDSSSALEATVSVLELDN